MHGPINFKSPNNISEWQMGFNSAFKGLIYTPPHLILKNWHFAHMVYLRDLYDSPNKQGLFP